MSKNIGYLTPAPDMVNEIKANSPRGLDKGRGSKFSVDSRVQQ